MKQKTKIALKMMSLLLIIDIIIGIVMFYDISYNNTPTICLGTLILLLINCIIVGAFTMVLNEVEG